MPTKVKIKKYWEGKLGNIEDFGETFDNTGKLINDGSWNELRIDGCWRCGKIGYVERAHINPRCEGGSDSVDNLHLLCRVCHTESEGMTSFKPNSLYYEWFFHNGWWEDIRCNIIKKMAKSYNKDLTNMTDLRFLVKELYENQENIYKK